MPPTFDEIMSRLCPPRAETLAAIGRAIDGKKWPKVVKPNRKKASKR